MSTFSVLTASKSAEFGSRKAGLLRLFQSEHFDVNMALSYLWKYNQGEAGIQSLICSRLTERPLGELTRNLPQICHLVVFNSIESATIEHLLLSLCHRSLHAAIFTLWFLENYLNDLRTTFPKNGHYYLRALRFLGELHKILFREPSPALNFSSLTESNSSSSIDEVSKGQLKSHPARIFDSAISVAAHLLPGTEVNVIAAGVTCAGLIVPSASDCSRETILVEARRVSFGRQRQGKPIRHALNGSGLTTRPVYSKVTPSVEDLHSGSAFSLKDYLLKAAKQMQMTATPLASRLISNPLHEAPPPTIVNNSPPPVPLYYLAEMQFIMSLIDISSRLVSVARDNRLKALTAELALINHNLPASLCVPLWCNSDENCLGKDECSTPKGHHRILRICPNDAVVLNSAERVPFLLLIEVLDSDFSDEDFSRLISPCQAAVAVNNRNSLRLTLTDIPLCHSAETVEVTERIQGEMTTGLSESIEPLYPVKSYEETNSDMIAMPLSSDDFTERMRTAAIMLAQLTRQASKPGCPARKLDDIAAIKDKIIREMEQLEKNRLFDALQKVNTEEGTMMEVGLPLDRRDFFDREDPSAVVFQESLIGKTKRIKESSPYGHLEGWRLLSVIVKSGSDMRQEQLACQLISEMTNIWNSANLPLWTYSYRVLVASCNGGLVETVPNAISIHSIKKNAYMKNKTNPAFVFSLRDHFIKTFGSPDSDAFRMARDNFLQSLAAYSLITYVLQIKDRHDGNILLDNEGHLIHIDYGFMLSNSPGYVGFESAPFKLSQEYIELLGGLHSPEFGVLKDLIFQGFLELRKHADRIVVLLDIMHVESRLPCFYSGETALTQLRQRLHLTLTDSQLRQVVDRLVISSAFNVFTKLYDSYQYYSNGIF